MTRLSTAFVAAALLAGSTVADEVLAGKPFKVVLSWIDGSPYPKGDGVPFGETWTIHSSGECEFTFETWKNRTDDEPTKTTRRFQLAAEVIAGIRKSIQDARYFELEASYGPRIRHGDWMSLNVVVDKQAKEVKLYSPTVYATLWREEHRLKATQAMQVWLTVCEAIDSDRKHFPQVKEIRKALVLSAKNGK